MEIVLLKEKQFMAPFPNFIISFNFSEMYNNNNYNKISVQPLSKYGVYFKKF